MQSYTSGRFQPEMSQQQHHQHHHRRVSEDIDPLSSPPTSSIPPAYAERDPNEGASSSSHTHSQYPKRLSTDVTNKRLSTISQTAAYTWDPDRRASQTSEQNNQHTDVLPPRKPSFVDSLKLGWHYISAKGEPHTPQQRAAVEAAEFQNTVDFEDPPELPAPARRMSKTGGYVASHAGKDAVTGFYGKEERMKRMSITGSTRGEPRKGSLAGAGEVSACPPVLAE